MSHYRGPHAQTLTGGHWWPFDPQPEDVRFDDLRSLSHINRYGGHTLVPYNDAEHMVRVARRVHDLGGGRLVVRAALGHDVHEAYPPADQLGPFLRAWQSVDACALLGMTPAAFDGIAAIVQRAKWAVRTRLDIDDVFAHEPHARLIKRADMELLATERRDLMAPSDVDWGMLPDPLPERIVPWTPERAWGEFCEMWEEFGGGAAMTRAEAIDRIVRALPGLTDTSLELLAAEAEAHERRPVVGVAAIIGRWPGDESDEDVARALEEIS